MNLLLDYDIVVLQEIKTAFVFSLPGFICIHSAIIPGEEARGGVAVLFKNSVWQHVETVKTLKDQVWFTLRSAPGLGFGGCYLTPIDSSYFSNDRFATIQEQSIDTSKEVVIIRDLNACLPDMSCFSKASINVNYTANPDTIENAHGKEILSICKDFLLVPVNHMCYKDVTCDGGLTYRQKDQWVSQIDWALIS